MGFSDLAAQVIMVFLFIIIFTALFSSYKNYISSTSENLDYVYNDLINKIQTDLTVTDVNYNTGLITLTAQNSGSTTLDPSLLDVFIGGTKIARTDLTLKLFNQTTDTLYWNPTEFLNISFTQVLSQNTLAQVSTEYGISAFIQVQP